MGVTQHSKKSIRNSLKFALKTMFEFNGLMQFIDIQFGIRKNSLIFLNTIISLLAYGGTEDRKLLEPRRFLIWLNMFDVDAGCRGCKICRRNENFARKELDNGSDATLKMCGPTNCHKPGVKLCKHLWSEVFSTTYALWHLDSNCYEFLECVAGTSTTTHRRIIARRKVSTHIEL